MRTIVTSLLFLLLSVAVGCTSATLRVEHRDPPPRCRGASAGSSSSRLYCWFSPEIVRLRPLFLRRLRLLQP